MEEMKIQQKVFEMMEYAYVCLQQFPKSEKFALVVDIKELKANDSKKDRRL